MSQNGNLYREKFDRIMNIDNNNLSKDNNINNNIKIEQNKIIEKNDNYDSNNIFQKLTIKDKNNESFQSKKTERLNEEPLKMNFIKKKLGK